KKPNLGENRKVTVRMERTGASPRSSRKTQGNPPSATYRLIWEAARARQQITCLYGSHHREACPHIVGYKEFGEEAVFVFQFGGTSTKGLPQGGAWRCLIKYRMFRFEPADGSPEPATAAHNPASNLSISMSTYPRRSSTDGHCLLARQNCVLRGSRAGRSAKPSKI